MTHRASSADLILVGLVVWASAIAVGVLGAAPEGISAFIAAIGLALELLGARSRVSRRAWLAIVTVSVMTVTILLPVSHYQGSFEDCHSVIYAAGPHSPPPPADARFEDGEYVECIDHTWISPVGILLVTGIISLSLLHYSARRSASRTVPAPQGEEP